MINSIIDSFNARFRPGRDEPDDLPLLPLRKLVLRDCVEGIRWHFESQTEPHEEEFKVFSYFPGADEVFLDIGANIGISAILEDHLLELRIGAGFQDCIGLQEETAGYFSDIQSQQSLGYIIT
jgi:hypothetical protein